MRVGSRIELDEYKNHGLGPLRLACLHQLFHIRITGFILTKANGYSSTSNIFYIKVLISFPLTSEQDNGLLPTLHLRSIASALHVGR